MCLNDLLSGAKNSEGELQSKRPEQPCSKLLSLKESAVPMAPEGKVKTPKIQQRRSERPECHSKRALGRIGWKPSGREKKTSIGVEEGKQGGSLDFGTYVSKKIGNIIIYIQIHTLS